MPAMTDSRKDIRKAVNIAAKIRPLLAGHGPEVQGAVLAELLSIWLAGFPPEMREDMLAMHIEHMRPLVTINAAIIRGKK